MAAATNVIVSILIILNTLGSFFVLYQLFSGLYCSKVSKQPHLTGSASATAPASQGSSGSKSSNNKSNDLSVSTPRKEAEDRQPEPIHKFFKINTIAICISFSIICIACAMDRIGLLNNPNFSLISTIIFPLYFIGRILLSLIFIGRLHFTFHGSVFAYTRCTMNALKCSWIIMVISALLGVVFFIPVFDPALRMHVFGMMFSTLFILIDIVLSFVLLYLYAKKLHILISAHDEFLLSVMTKYSLLYTVCFVSTFSVFLMAGIQLAAATSGPGVFDEGDVGVFMSVDSILNSVCLWLNLKFAVPWYYRLCGWGDKQCTKCCVSCSNNTVENQFMIKSEIVSSDLDSDQKRSVERLESNPKPVGIQLESSTGNQAIIS
eukprot:10177_1